MKTQLNEFKNLLAITFTDASPLEQLPYINARLVGKMHALVFTAKSNRLLRRHFTQVQQECIFLLDELHLNYQHLERQHFDEIGNSINSVLNAIQQHYPQFFNNKLNVPIAYLKEKQAENRDGMNRFHASIKRLSIDLGLQQLIMGAFEKFNDCNDATYQHVSYMLELRQSLSKALSTLTADCANQGVNEHLTFYNFNTRSYLDWFKDKINSESKQLYNNIDHLGLLMSYKKRLRQMQQKIDYAYNCKRNSVKHQLLIFLNNEICFLRQRQEGSGSAIIQQNHYRVKVTISSELLIYLFRLLIESGVIEANPRSNLISFIAEHFETPRTKESLLSVGSLTNKYKAVNQHTAMQMKALLQNLVKQIDADFGR